MTIEQEQTLEWEKISAVKFCQFRVIYVDIWYDWLTEFWVPLYIKGLFLRCDGSRGSQEKKVIDMFYYLFKMWNCVIAKCASVCKIYEIERE